MVNWNSNLQHSHKEYNKAAVDILQTKSRRP